MSWASAESRTLQPVEGRAPVASSVAIVGFGADTIHNGYLLPATWGTPLSVKYDFNDADLDDEYIEDPSTHINWYLEDVSDGSSTLLHSGSELGQVLPSDLDPSKNQNLKVCVTPQTDPKLTLPSSGAAVCSSPMPIYKASAIVIDFTPNIFVNDGRPWSYLYVDKSNRANGSLLDRVRDFGVGGTLYFRYRDCRRTNPHISCEHVVDWPSSTQPSNYPNLLPGSTGVELHVGNFIGSAVALRWSNTTGGNMSLSLDGTFGGENSQVINVFDYYIDIIKQDGRVITLHSMLNAPAGRYIKLSDDTVFLSPGDSIQFTQVLSKSGQSNSGAASLVILKGKGYLLNEHQ